MVWACSPSPLPFVKPRDFVTVVNVRRLEDGTVVVVNRGYRHPDAPPTSEYVRGEVILAANVMRPDAKDKNKTHFTMLTQVGAEAWAEGDGGGVKWERGGEHTSRGVF